MTPGPVHVRAASDEFQVLRLSAHTVSSDTTRAELRGVVEGALDWSLLVAEARRHHLTPLLHRALADGCPDLVPPRVLESLEADCAEIGARNRFLLQELLGILDALEARGVRAIPFKGPLLAVQAYGDVGLRMFRDLDFLIRPKDVWKTLDALRERCYDVDSPFTAAQLAGTWRALGQDLFRRRDRQVTVEPHWAFTPDRMAVVVDYPGVWERARPHNVDGHTVLGLSPEDTLTALSLHGAKERWWRLNWVADVAAFLHSYGELEWDELLERARAQGCRRMVLAALMLAQRVLGAPLPPVVTRAAATDRAVAWLVDGASRRLVSRGERSAPSFDRLSWFRLRAHDGPRRQLSYVTRTLLRPNPRHYEMVALPAWCGFGYYGVKLVHDYVMLPAWSLFKSVRRRSPKRR